MSLASLCSIQTATIKRVNAKQGATMGQIRTGANDYTTANRGSLPTTIVGRLVPEIGGERRFAYEMHDLPNDYKFYTLTNPQVDESDMLVVGSLLLFVQNLDNPDTLNRYYVITVKSFTRGLQ